MKQWPWSWPCGGTEVERKMEMVLAVASTSLVVTMSWKKILAMAKWT